MVEFGKKTLRAWTRMLRAHALATGAVEEALKAAGLPALDVHRVLAELERGPPEGLRPFELEQALAAPQYQISRLVDRIAKANMVTRTACEDDRRGWRIGLTDSGRLMRARMWEVASAAIATNFVDRLGDKQIRQLDEIFGDLLDASPTR